MTTKAAILEIDTCKASIIYWLDEVDKSVANTDVQEVIHDAAKVMQRAAELQQHVANYERSLTVQATNSPSGTMTP